MPTLIIIDGIRIVMYPSDHPPPHVHAWKNGRDAQFEIATGRVMEGQMDRKTIRTVQAWITLNQDLLFEAWTYCQTPNPTMTKS
jgi:Domain of unknown function (DUF4160)